MNSPNPNDCLAPPDNSLTFRLLTTGSCSNAIKPSNYTTISKQLSSGEGTSKKNVERFLKIKVDNCDLFVYNDKVLKNIAGWSSPVARRAHNPKVGGSNPPPATKKKKHPIGCFFFFHWSRTTDRKAKPTTAAGGRRREEDFGTVVDCMRTECEQTDANDKRTLVQIRLPQPQRKAPNRVLSFFCLPKPLVNCKRL